MDAGELNVADRIEVRLKERDFETALVHHRQAKSAMDREEWESANAQTRSFLEALCEAIAKRLSGPQGEKLQRGQARSFLQKSGFLDSNEGDLLKALFGVLHGKGSHSGTSARDDAYRRFVIASSLGSYYLERLDVEEDVYRESRLERLAETLGPRGWMVPASEYESVDFDTVEIEGESVVLETDYDYGLTHGRKQNVLGKVWLDEFIAIMFEWANHYCIVLTERLVEADELKQVADGVHELLYPRDAFRDVFKTQSFHVLIIETPVDDEEASAERVALARDRLAATIRSDFEPGQAGATT